jgi:hypothetical protein
MGAAKWTAVDDDAAKPRFPLNGKLQRVTLPQVVSLQVVVDLGDELYRGLKAKLERTPERQRGNGRRGGRGDRRPEGPEGSGANGWTPRRGGGEASPLQLLV